MDSTPNRPPVPSIQDTLAAHASTGLGKQPPLEVILHNGGKFGWVVRLLPWVFSGFLVLMSLGFFATLVQPEDGPIEKHYSHSKDASDKVAIITVSGVIISGDGFVKQQLDRVRKDENVKAIVLRINSPGGTITGSHYIYDHLRELVKEKDIPIVVSMGAIAASGGYYVAMASGAYEKNVIFAEPTTTTGSIGVIIPHYDISEFLNKHGIKSDPIKSHPYKDMGSISRKMTDEEKKLFQSYVDASLDRFIKVIEFGRPHFKQPALAKKMKEELATGRVFTTDEAIANRLVDEEGYIEDAITRAIQLADLDENNVNVVRYRKQPGLLDALGVGVKSSHSDPVALLKESAVPRACYLYSWMPEAAMLQEEQTDTW